jgi:hypothetical protein
MAKSANRRNQRKKKVEYYYDTDLQIELLHERVNALEKMTQHPKPKPDDHAEDGWQAELDFLARNDELVQFDAQEVAALRICGFTVLKRGDGAVMGNKGLRIYAYRPNYPEQDAFQMVIRAPVRDMYRKMFWWVPRCAILQALGDAEQPDASNRGDKEEKATT